MAPRFNLTSPALLAALGVVYLLPGLAGHDLWKSQDAIALGIVHDMATRGNLLVPHVAGTPWLQDGPLYHWFALAFGLVLRVVMPFHEAARLASGAFVAAAFGFLYLAARKWSESQRDRRSDYEDGRTAGSAAMLILLGSVGLMVYAHEALPELASLAAICGAFASLPYAPQRPLHAGVGLGLGLGLAFVAGSWIAPLGMLVAVAAAHAACPEWRTRAAAPFLAAMLVVGSLVALSWPMALEWRAPSAFIEWWSYLHYLHGTAEENARHLVSNASWFTWPAWPLALWSAWSLRRRWREPRLFVPAASLIVIVGLQIARGMPQDESLLALLPPLALLAAPGLFTLRRGAVAALDWFGVLAFAFFTGLVWVGYSALTFGVPEPVARNLAHIAPGFTAQIHPLGLLLAAALAIAWVYLVFFTPFNPMRGVARWAGGIVLLWGTFALLCMSWVDYQKSYRSVALQLRAKIPPHAPCLAERSLGISQAAALDYHGGIRARPFDLFKPAACPLVLVQGEPLDEHDAPPPVGKRRWIKLADVGRPGDRTERYRLYRLGK